MQQTHGEIYEALFTRLMSWEPFSNAYAQDPTLKDTADAGWKAFCNNLPDDSAGVKKVTFHFLEEKTPCNTLTSEQLLKK